MQTRRKREREKEKERGWEGSPRRMNDRATRKENQFSLARSCFHDNPISLRRFSIFTTSFELAANSVARGIRNIRGISDLRSRPMKNQAVKTSIRRRKILSQWRSNTPMIVYQRISILIIQKSGKMAFSSCYRIVKHGKYLKKMLFYNYIFLCSTFLRHCILRFAAKDFPFYVRYEAHIL